MPTEFTESIATFGNTELQDDKSFYTFNHVLTNVCGKL